MKINKEYILSKAFEQYLEHGYAGVSVSLLQKQLNIGRATLYYYFKNKDSLFCAILDKYLTSYMKALSTLQNDMLLIELIDARIKLTQQVQDYIDKLNNDNINLSNLSSLILFSYMNYPKYKIYLEEIQQTSKDQWEAAIRNGIQQGEIKPETNIDVLSDIFTNIKSGYESGIIYLKDAEFYQTACHYLYKLVKTQKTKAQTNGT